MTMMMTHLNSDWSFFESKKEIMTSFIYFLFSYLGQPDR